MGGEDKARTGSDPMADEAGATRGKKLVKKKVKKSSRKTKLSTVISVCWLLGFGTLVCGVVGSYAYLIKWQHKQELKYEEKLKEELDPMTKEWEEKVISLQEENRELQESAEEIALQQEKDRLEKEIHLEEQHRREVMGYQDHVKSLTQTRKQLQTAIQHMSEQSVIKE